MLLYSPVQQRYGTHYCRYPLPGKRLLFWPRIQEARERESDCTCPRKRCCKVLETVDRRVCSIKMRRGTGVTGATTERRRVTADVDDLEGGGSGGYAASAAAAPQSSVSTTSLLPSMEIAAAASNSSNSVYPSATNMYDGNKGKRVKHGSDFWANILTNPQLHAILQQLLGTSSQTLQMAVIALFIGTCLLFPFFSVAWSILLVVAAACIFGGMAALWLSQSVLSQDEGTPEMRAVSEPIREGAAGFLKVQYTAIAQFAIPLAAAIFVSYQFRPIDRTQKEGVAVLGNVVLGLVAAFAFAFGAICSGCAGYVSMIIASLSNIRVASAGRRSYSEALIVCFRGGAFSAVLNLTLCVAGVTSLYALLMVLFAGSLQTNDIPILMVGYGFGASFVALFMQLVRNRLESVDSNTRHPFPLLVLKLIFP